MKLFEFLKEDGRIVKGVNTTPDVDVDEIPKQAAKFGNKVDVGGRPPTLSTKVKGKSTNVLFNLGLAEKTYSAYELALMEGGHSLPEEHSWPKGHGSEIAWLAYNNELVEELENIGPNTEIYVDMDGVLADFFGDWAKLMNKKHWTDIEDPANAINKIKTVDDFWLNLPLTKNAKPLLMLIKRVKGSYNILSSPLADDPKSIPHKKEWIKKNLSFFPPRRIFLTHDKAQYATNSDGSANILIDDYGVNINKWSEAGGIGFKHKDHKFERTVKNLKGLR